MAVSPLRARGRSPIRSGREGPAFLDDLIAMAGSLANSRKEHASARIEDLAGSVRQFSDALPSMPTVKTYAETAADSLDDLARYVLERDVPEMLTDARELARRHPLATFGGSILAGIALTQLVQTRADAMRTRRTTRRAGGRNTAQNGGSAE